MDSQEKKPFQRLSHDVIPVMYDVCLQPDLVGLTFKGWETVSINVSFF